MQLPPDLQRFVFDSFPPEDCATACSLLAGACIETGAAPGDHLLRCAAFAGRGGLAALQRHVSMLAIDWRDVVVAAEYELRDGVPVQVRDHPRPLTPGHPRIGRVGVDVAGAAARPLR